MKRFAMLAATLLALALVTPASASSNVGFNVGIWMPGASIQFGTVGPPGVYYDGPYVMAGIGVPLYFYGGSFFYWDGGHYHYYGRCNQRDYAYYENHWNRHYAYYRARPREYGPPVGWHPHEAHYRQYPQGRMMPAGRARYQGPVGRGPSGHYEKSFGPGHGWPEHSGGGRGRGGK
jgi:hypothetical protein